MKRPSTVVLSVGAAVLAAAVVLGVHFASKSRRGDAHAGTPPAFTTPAHRDALVPTLPPPPPPPGQRPSSAPVLPEALRANATPPPLPANLPNQQELREQFAMLRRFLELPPDKLARMRESIERIERMPPERKKMMLERIRQANPPASTPAETDLLGSVPEDLRPQVVPIVESMDPAARAALIERVSHLSNSERVLFFEGMAAAAQSPADPVPWMKSGGTPFGTK